MNEACSTAAPSPPACRHCLSGPPNQRLGVLRPTRSTHLLTAPSGTDSTAVGLGPLRLLHLMLQGSYKRLKVYRSVRLLNKIRDAPSEQFRRRNAAMSVCDQ